MQERGTITLNFPAQVKSITSGCLSQTVTTSGQYMTSTDPKDYTFTCKLEEGYKISGIDFTDGTGGYNSLSGFTDDTFTISISSHYGLTSTVGINVSEVQKVQKSISLDNLAQFKANCDQTYAKVGESSKGGYQDQQYIDSRFDVGSLTYTDNVSGISIPVNYYYQKGSVDPNTVAISGTIDISVSGSSMLSVPFSSYAEFYCALQLCFEFGTISGTSYDLEVQCNDIETLRSNIQTYWAFPYDFSLYKYPNAPYVYSDYGVKDFDIKIEESGQYISSGFHRGSYHFYYQVDTTGFIKNVDSKYKINFTSYSNVLPAPAPGYAGQVPVVNAAGNGYDLQAQSSGGGSGIYKHYITDVEDRRATIFTNNGDVMTEWPTDGSGIIVLSLGQVKNGEGLGNILFLDSEGADPLAPEYVYVTRGGSVSNEHFAEIQSDEVTAV